MLSIHPPFFSSSLRDSHAVWSCLLSERERERERENNAGIAEKKTNAHREAPFLPSQNASVEAFCRCLRVYPEQMGFEMI